MAYVYQNSFIDLKADSLGPLCNRYWTLNVHRAGLKTDLQLMICYVLKLTLP